MYALAWRKGGEWNTEVRGWSVKPPTHSTIHSKMAEEKKHCARSWRWRKQEGEEEEEEEGRPRLKSGAVDACGKRKERKILLWLCSKVHPYFCWFPKGLQEIGSKMRFLAKDVAHIFLSIWQLPRLGSTLFCCCKYPSENRCFVPNPVSGGLGRYAAIFSFSSGRQTDSGAQEGRRQAEDCLADWFLNLTAYRRRAERHSLSTTPGESVTIMEQWASLENKYSGVGECLVYF